MNDYSLAYNFQEGVKILLGSMRKSKISENNYLQFLFNNFKKPVTIRINDLNQLLADSPKKFSMKLLGVDAEEELNSLLERNIFLRWAHSDSMYERHWTNKYLYGQNYIVVDVDDLDVEGWHDIDRLISVLTSYKDILPGLKTWVKPFLITGHLRGLHIYFPASWLVDKQASHRMEAIRTLQAYVVFCLAKAKVRGLVDMGVCDRARAIRVPLTLRVKSGSDPVLYDVLYHNLKNIVRYKYRTVSHMRKVLLNNFVDFVGHKFASDIPNRKYLTNYSNIYSDLELNFDAATYQNQKMKVYTDNIVWIDNIPAAFRNSVSHRQIHSVISFIRRNRSKVENDPQFVKDLWTVYPYTLGALSRYLGLSKKDLFKHFFEYKYMDKQLHVYVRRYFNIISAILYNHKKLPYKSVLTDKTNIRCLLHNDKHPSLRFDKRQLNFRCFSNKCPSKTISFFNYIVGVCERYGLYNVKAAFLEDMEDIGYYIDKKNAPAPDMAFRRIKTMTLKSLSKIAAIFRTFKKYNINFYMVQNIVFITFGSIPIGMYKLDVVDADKVVADTIIKDLLKKLGLNMQFRGVGFKYYRNILEACYPRTTIYNFSSWLEDLNYYSVHQFNVYLLDYKKPRKKFDKVSYKVRTYRFGLSYADFYYFVDKATYGFLLSNFYKVYDMFLYHIRDAEYRLSAEYPMFRASVIYSIRGLFERTPEVWFYNMYDYLEYAFNFKHAFYYVETELDKKLKRRIEKLKEKRRRYVDSVEGRFEILRKSKGV